MSTGRKVTFAGITLLGGLMLGVGVAEAYLRANPPKLRMQVFRDGHNVRIVSTEHGPYWVPENRDNERTKTGCPGGDGSTTVALAGSSILFGSGLKNDESTGPVLRTALQQRGESDPCVLNYAVPGTTWGPQYARVATELPAQVDVLVWEVWQNSVHDFVQLGDTVYNFGQLSPGPGLVPDPWGLGSLNRTLLGTSRIYELAALTSAPQQPSQNVALVWADFVDDAFPRMQALADSRGAELVLVTCPFLDKPFAEQAQFLDRAYGPMVQAAQDADVRVLQLDRAFGDVEPEAIRHDPCCHYNADGMKLVGSLLADVIRPAAAPVEVEMPGDEPAPE